MMLIRSGLFALCLTAAPLAGQEALPEAPDGSDAGQGLSLMEEGARLFLRSMIDKMEPALRDLAGRFSQLQGYYPPEILPNGDILLRRRPSGAPLPDWPFLPGPRPGRQEDPDPGAEIEI